MGIFDKKIKDNVIVDSYQAKLDELNKMAKSTEMSIIDIFKFASPEIPIIKEVKGKDWIFYGMDNLYPTKLKFLLNQSAIHNAIVLGRSTMMAGKGFLVNGAKTKEESDIVISQLDANTQKLYTEFLNNNNNDLDIQEIITKISYDYQVYGEMALEIVWSMDFSRIATIKYVNAANIRSGYLCNDKVEHYWYSRNWAFANKDGYKPVKIAAFDEKNKEDYNQLIFIKSGNEEYYGEPFYKGSLAWIETDAAMANFHLSNIQNGFSPSMTLKFYQKPASPEEQSKIVNAIKKQYSGTGNAGKAMIFFSDGKDLAPDVAPIDISNLDKQYLALSELAVQNILTGAQVTTPMLFGISTPGSLGANTELETGYNIFNNSVIAPDRIKLEKLFNKILKINKIPVTITIEAFNPLV